jgi:hypothetical protein
MKRGILFIICMTGFMAAYSQSFIKPNYGLKSHETLDIRKIESTPEGTTFYMNVKNTRIQGGSFCTDKNTYIIYPDGTREKLTSARNIPVCPDIHKFKAPGEQLDFVLVFPPLRPGTEWIDLVEECTDYCFSFYGVTLDNKLNKFIDSVFNKASYQKPSENITLFKSLIDSLGNRNLGIEGLLYINIIDAAMAESDKVNTIVWYKRLATSNAPRLNQYLKYLNNKGIKY